MNECKTSREPKGEILRIFSQYQFKTIRPYFQKQALLPLLPSMLSSLPQTEKAGAQKPGGNYGTAFDHQEYLLDTC